MLSTVVIAVVITVVNKRLCRDTEENRYADMLRVKKKKRADRVFTGTHEDIETKKGVTRNMINPNAYFKPAPSPDRPVLAAAQVPASTLSSSWS